MDPSILAAQAVTILKPFLSLLVGGTIAAAGREIWTGVWSAIHPVAKENPALEGAIVQAASAPTDEDNVAALRNELKKALAADPLFAGRLEAALGSTVVQMSNDTYTGIKVVASKNVDIGPKFRS